MEKKIPVLGICLGVQLFARHSEEGDAAGLGWLAADVKKFKFPAGSNLAVPHMGWNELETADTVLFKGQVPGESRYYFVHSYHLVVDDSSNVAGWVNYGYRFAASVRQGNIYGTQFHPEKSHKHGMLVLRNWLEAVGHAP
jgi:glutamine amidotransferase